MNQNNYGGYNNQNNGYGNQQNGMQGYNNSNMQPNYNNQGNYMNGQFQQGYGMNNNGKSNNGGNKVFIIIVVVAVIAIIALVLLLVLGDKKGNNPAKTAEERMADYEKKQEEAKAKLIKNISYKVENEYTDDKDTDIIFSLSSTNNDFVNITIPVKFYDENNVQVTEENLYFTCVQSGVKVYDVASLYDKKYSTYKIVDSGIDAYSPIDKSQCVDYKDKIETKVELATSGEEYNVLVTNKTGKSVGLYGYLVYYTNDKVAGLNYISFNSIDVNGTAKESSYIPYNHDDYKRIKVDKAEFILSEVVAAK